MASTRWSAVLVTAYPVRPLPIGSRVGLRDGRLHGFENCAEMFEAIKLPDYRVDSGLVKNRVGSCSADRLRHASGQYRYELFVLLPVFEQSLQPLPTAANFNLFLLLVDEHVKVVERYVVISGDTVLLEVETELCRGILHLLVLILVLSNELLRFEETLLSKLGIGNIGSQILFNSCVCNSSGVFLKLVQDVEMFPPAVRTPTTMVLAIESPTMDESWESHDLGGNVGEVALGMAVAGVLDDPVSGSIVLLLDTITVCADGARHPEILLTKFKPFKLELLAQRIARQS